MSKVLRSLVVSLAGICLACSGALASKVDVLQADNVGQESQRIALVIGNSDYEHITDLDNTLNDARAIAKSLKATGFQVIKAENMTRRGMNDVTEQFLAAVKPGAEALIYYAGHGVELAGENYLLPTDIRKLNPSQKRTLRAESISLNELLEDLRVRKARVNLVLLDACRDNPFPTENTRSLGGSAGLGRVDPPHGTVVVYAAAAGEKALDKLSDADDNPNGLFTRHLLDLMSEPGLEIRPLVQNLKERVYNDALKVSSRTQRPSYYDGLIGKFYFRPKAQALTLRHPCEVLIDPRANSDAILANDYTAVMSVCQRAIVEYPDNERFRDLLQLAEEQLAVKTALTSTKPEAARTYLNRYAQGKYHRDVQIHLASIDPTAALPQIQKAAVETGQARAVDGDAEKFIPEKQVVPILSNKELALQVQSELNRVGCSAGNPDGIWGKNSRNAVRSYVRNIPTGLASLDPSPELLLKLREEKGRVCKLTCSARQELSGGQCVAKTCARGEKLSSKGQCYTPKKTAARSCSQGQKKNSKGVCYTPRTSVKACPSGQRKNSRGVCYTPKREVKNTRPAKIQTRPQPAKTSKPAKKKRLDGYTGWSKCPALANNSC